MSRGTVRALFLLPKIKVEGMTKMKAVKDSSLPQPKLNKKRCQSGMDGMELALKLENMENLYLPKEESKNKAGNTIVGL